MDQSVIFPGSSADVESTLRHFPPIPSDDLICHPHNPVSKLQPMEFPLTKCVTDRISDNLEYLKKKC